MTTLKRWMKKLLIPRNKKATGTSGFHNKYSYKRNALNCLIHLSTNGIGGLSNGMSMECQSIIILNKNIQ